MFHVLDLNTARGTLEQNGPRVPRQRDRADEDHDGDEHARRRVCIETRLEPGLPDYDGGYDDPDVVDGVSDDVDENAEHAEVTAGLLKMGHIVTVLGVGLEGVDTLVCCAAGHDGVKVMAVDIVIAVAVAMVM